MDGDGTVEWGEDRPVRLLDRLFGDGRGKGYGLSAPAVGAAVVAAALFLAAELLPWATIEQPGQGNTTVTRDVAIDNVGVSAAIAYHIGLVLLLAVVGLAQVSRPHSRRALTAAGIGVSAGLLVLLFGLVRQARDTGEQFVNFDAASPDAAVGSAPFIAIAGVLMAVAALVASGWHPAVATRARRQTPAEDGAPDDEDDEPGPIDLTVTPA